LYQLQLRSGLLRKRTPLGGKHLLNNFVAKISERQFFWSENWQKSYFSSTPTLNTGVAALLLKNKYRPFFGIQETAELIALWFIRSLDSIFHRLQR